MSAAKISSDTPPRQSLAHQAQQLRRNLQTPISAARIALERKISLNFPHFRGFLTETSSNISLTGMFIQSREPQAPGTLVDFAFSLTDGLELIRGRGEVVWVRRREDGPKRPPGMGIRFLRLDAESRRLIRWAVEKQIAEGNEPFQLDSQPANATEASPRSASSSSAPTPTAGRKAPHKSARSKSKEAPRDALADRRAQSGSRRDVRKLYPYAGYAKAKSSNWWPSKEQLRMAAVAVAAAPFIALVAALYLSHSSSSSTALARAQEPEPVSAAPTTPAAPSVPAPAEEPTPTVEPAPVSEVTPIRDEMPSQQLLDLTEAWATAWAEQRPADYVRFYSSQFVPPQAMSRDAWEQLRANRISRPDFIQVGITNLQVELLAPDRGQVSFDQSYQSDSYRDRTRKILDLVLEDSEWKILAERVSS